VGGGTRPAAGSTGAVVVVDVVVLAVVWAI